MVRFLSLLKSFWLYFLILKDVIYCYIPFSLIQTFALSIIIVDGRNWKRLDLNGQLLYYLMACNVWSLMLLCEILCCLAWCIFEKGRIIDVVKLRNEHGHEYLILVVDTHWHSLWVSQYNEGGHHHLVWDYGFLENNSFNLFFDTFDIWCGRCFPTKNMILLHQSIYFRYILSTLHLTMIKFQFFHLE